MKKNKLYTINKYNKPAFMQDANIFYGGGSVWGTPSDAKMESWANNWANNLSGEKLSDMYKNYGSDILSAYKDSKNAFGISKQNNPFSKMNIGSTMGNIATAAAPMVGNLAKSAISGGFSTGVGEGISSIGSTVGSALMAVNPIVGGAVTLGSNLLGGLWNAAFGVKLNEDVINRIKDNAARMTEAGNTLSQASTNSEVLNAAGNMGSAMNFDYSDLGSTGFLRSNGRLKREEKRLKNTQNLALAKQSHGLITGASNADRTQDDLVMSGFYADGGLLNLFEDGGGIHIKPSHRGRLTELKARTGKTEAELYNDGNPAHKKMVVFARNARKWNHAYGGPLGYFGTNALGIMQNDKYIDAINHRSDMIAKNNIIQPVNTPQDVYAFGGELGTNGTDWTNGLLYVDAGGTHQQNPLGGVPVGFDQNGVPNLVEEGETIWNDYVFSDRMKVPKAMFHTLGLGGAMKKGITFAKASKELAKESEQRPNDPLSMAGLEASLSKLAAVQEAERMKKEMRRNVGLENMAAYGGPVNRYDYGGALNWLKEHYGNKYNAQELDALAKYLSNKVSDTRTIRLNNGSEIQDNKNKSLLDQEYSNAMNNVSGSSMFGFGEDKLDNLITIGTNPELAYNIVSKDLRQGSNRNRLYSYMVSLPSAAPSAASISSEKTITPSVQNSGVDEFLAAMDNTTTLPQREAPAQQQARARAAASFGYTPGVGGGVRNQSGIIPYAYYTNGSDGYSTPTGFKVGENGMAYDYTQEYRDLVGKLTADDIRAWAKEHPDDISLKSFLARRNNLDNLTDEQWRTGALDGKYGFMHHVANSILNGDYTPAPQSTNPYGIQTPDVPAQEGEVSKVPADAVNGEPQVNPENTTKPRVEDKRPTLDARLRYAPALGSALGVFGDLFGLTNNPDYTYADKLEAAANAAGYAPNISYQPVGDYMRYTPFDRLFYANQLQANARATDRALGNSSSPSRAAGLLANAYNTNTSLGNLYRQGDEYNLAQRQQVADFNRRTNMFNSQMGLEAAIANARYNQVGKQYKLSGLAQAAALRDDIDRRVSAARSANLTNLFNSLGNIGRENMSLNMVNSTSAANNGYWIDRNGIVHYINRKKKGEQE